MYKQGDVVRHRSKPEWGVGRITGQTGEGKVLIKFSSRSGDVLLTPDGAAAHLVPDTGVVGAISPQVVRHVAPVRRAPCVTCSADVRAVVTSRDGAWRSCVACSARNGRQHVFMPFPGGFDVIDPPLGDDEVSDDPHYGWCRACRASTRAFGYKNCNLVMR
ncbi:MAG: DUF3553 domain-containing protein [Acidobacteria bacterium]|jgi:hypothetical protein|nr:DUF3553 domain-containing protein [Acidobacteriota bacterium]